MKAKRLLFLSMAVGALLGFTGCLKNEGNMQSWNNAPSYVNSSSGKITLDVLIPYAATVYAPALNGRAMMGDFGLSNFSIDYDNQPAGSSYYTADVTAWLPIDDSDVNFKPGSVANPSFPDSIFNAEFQSLALLNQNVIMRMTERNLLEEDYQYEMTCNTDSTTKWMNYTGSEPPTYEPFPMMYLAAKITTKSGTGNPTGDAYFHAFDLTQLLARKGSPGYQYVVGDTTLNGENYTYAKFNLLYQSGTDGKGNPVFTKYRENPVTVYQHKTAN